MMNNNDPKRPDQAGPAGGDGFELLRLAEVDLAEVLELERLVYAQPWTAENFSGEFNRRITLPLGLKKEGRVAAYCFFWLLPPEVHLLNVAVRPEFQGQGLAKRLLAAMIAVGRRGGAETFFLEVRPSNLPAVGLYQSLGFSTAGRRPNYYEDGEDALLMTLDL